MKAQRLWVQVLWVAAVRSIHAETLTQKKRKQKAWAFCTALATRMDNTSGRARVSFAQLSEDTGFSHDFLQAGAQAAGELGLLHIKTMHQPGSMRRDVPIYHARFPKGSPPAGYRRNGGGWEIDPSWSQHAPGGLDESQGHESHNASSVRAHASSVRILTKEETKPLESERSSDLESERSSDQESGDGAGSGASRREAPGPAAERSEGVSGVEASQAKQTRPGPGAPRNSLPARLRSLPANHPAVQEYRLAEIERAFGGQATSGETDKETPQG